MEMTKPIVIVQTGDVPSRIACVNFDAMFLRAGDYSRTGAWVAYAPAGALPDAGAVSGIIVTGSPAMVSDREPWSEACAAWLAQAVANGAHVLGVCYGHQLLAHALGGAVDYHPLGTELGTYEVRLSPAAHSDPLLAGLPDRFPVHLAHSQTVTALPAGARVLAGSEHDPRQIVRYTDRAISLQFHPEYDVGVMQAYLDALAGAPALGRAVRPGLPVRPTPEAALLLQRFIDSVAE
jgi:GMP synthase (glutamine-hydrolysing)